VERIEQNVVYLRFHNSLASHSSPSTRYNVEFTVNRRTWRTLLQGVNLAGDKKNRERARFLGQFLFPVDVSASAPVPPSDDTLLGTMSSLIFGTAIVNSRYFRSFN
jgi:hypothetical protein